LQGAGRVAAGEGFPPALNSKRFIQKNRLANFSAEIESQDHLGFALFPMEFRFVKFFDSAAQDPVSL
jgi:hypothetical protein